ncbi:MAG: PaaI family thioesterase [Nitrospirota bacterium]
MDLQDDHYCFVCGKKNPIGLRLDFYLDKDAKSMTTEFTPSKIHQGYKDIVHGGLISTVLDEIMVKLVIGLGMIAVTASMEIRLRKPLVVGERITVSARLLSKSKRLIEAEAKAVKDNGSVVAEARGKLIPWVEKRDSSGQVKI